MDAATATAIEGLNNKPAVTRLGGTDRYETAANLAAKIESESSWCGTEAASAVLINGGTDMLAYGVAVQTAVYRLQLPLLMTMADELPDTTAEFITDNDIEHVQIIGGTDVVSAGVASALTTLGVDTVARVDEASASEVSVELAKMANNGCNDDLGLVSADRVALVRGNPDGVVAAPALASSLTGGFMVTPLVVNEPMNGANSLPASVRDYLAATPKNIGADKLNLGIVAIGGTAAVSEATMDAAIEAAASSGALTVAIGAHMDTNGDKMTNADDPVRPDTGATASGGTAIVTTAGSEAGPMFSLYFSDDVTPDLAKLQDIIEINGVPAVVLNAAANQGTTCNKRRVDVTLGQALSGGDTISIVGSDAKFGAGKDQRTVAPASTTVMAAAPDRTRPTISIVGIAKATDATDKVTFYVGFSDNVMVATGTALAADEITLVNGPGGTDTTTTVRAATGGATVTLGRDLVAGDRLVIKPGAIADASGNVSAGTSGVAITAQASPRVQSVLMSNLKHSAHASWEVPSEVVGGVGETGQAMSITAKGSGDAAGAAGNGWKMVFDRASTFSAAKPLDIDVRVDTKGQRVTVRFNNGPDTATLGDLLAALKANAAFDARFAASFDSCENGDPKTRLGLLAVRNHEHDADGAGRTQFAIEVNFNAYVDIVRNDELLVDVLTATAVRNKLAWARAATDADNAALTTRRFGLVDDDATGGGGTAAGGALTIAADLSAATALAAIVEAATPPTRKVRYEFETSQVRFLPMARDLVETTAGHGGAASAITGPPAYTAIAADPGVATGFAADVTTPGATDDADDASDRVDENLNGGGQTRIGVSSSVKAPS